MASESVLVIEDEARVREVLARGLRAPDRAVRAVGSAEEAFQALETELPSVVVTDLRLPGADGLAVVRAVRERAASEGRTVPVVVVTAVDDLRTAVQAMAEGAFHYTVKGPDTLNEVRAHVARALEYRAALEENARLKVELKLTRDAGGMVGGSPAMQQVRQMIARVARTRINCVLIGESGTGKEVVARTIHEVSERSTKPFVAVNCGAIPETLFESELFGYKKGAFTGADRDRAGAFEAANHGTLFLDEVGELPLSMQVKLLRVIQDRKVTPLGTSTPVPVDVRILAATNRRLDREVAEGRFREDLYYRLNVVQIDVPPLRERREDILPLAEHFIARFNEEFGRDIVGLTPDAERALLAYGFPGNVRELQNIVERAVALEEGSRITLASLPERVRQQGVPMEVGGVEPGETGFDLDAVLAATERRFLLRALQEERGNRTRAAQRLGITFRSMRHRLQKLGLADEGFGDEEPSGTRSLPPSARVPD